MHVTLDDDQFGARESDNQVKMLSARKADKEGHLADVIVDALFRILSAIRFRRRGESQSDSATKLVSLWMEGERRR